MPSVRTDPDRCLLLPAADPGARGGPILIEIPLNGFRLRLPTQLTRAPVAQDKGPLGAACGGARRSEPG